MENRDWPTKYRGPVLLHAATWWSNQGVQADDRRARTLARLDGKDLLALSLDLSEPARPDRDGGLSPRMTEMRTLSGLIVGMAELVDCVEQHDSAWMTGPFGLILENVRPIAPFAARGKLGLFEVGLPYGETLETYLRRPA